jgi:hypothetical protein
VDEYFEPAVTFRTAKGRALCQNSIRPDAPGLAKEEGVMFKLALLAVIALFAREQRKIESRDRRREPRNRR